MPLIQVDCHCRASPAPVSKGFYGSDTGYLSKEGVSGKTVGHSTDSAPDGARDGTDVYRVNAA